MSVVNIRLTRDYDVYIGRRATHEFHFGNPFSHKPKSLAEVKVKSRAEAITNFELWITGQAFQEIEPKRREWILKKLPELKGKILGCYCYPYPCHGETLEKLANAPSC